MNLETKYTRVEFERRFLVSRDSDWRSYVESYSKLIEDKYLAGTRLRLRVMTDSDTGRQIIKLTKKSESTSPYYRTISRILLSPDEHMIFDRLDGNLIVKTRYYHNCRGRIFSVDVFEDELDGLVLCETESHDLDDLMSIEPPPFSVCEVTEESFFDGGKFFVLTRRDLQAKLDEMVKR